jgi:hypothetical protein
MEGRVLIREMEPPRGEAEIDLPPEARFGLDPHPRAVID